MKNRAFFLTAPKTLEMREIAMPVPEAGEVMIKIGAVGVCGSDVHYYSRGRIGDFIVQYPYILGHECAGIVVELGEGVKNLKVGDRVALEPGIPCGKCQMCKTGHYNLCPDVKFFATPPVEGCLMEYIVYPEEYTFKLTDNMTLEQGALVEPMAIGMNAALTAKVKAGDCVLIMGAGCIGLVTMLAAKANGAAKIIVSDVLKLRLDTALRLGATAAINSREDMYEEVMRLTNGKGPDVVIDCAGFSETVKMGIRVIRPAGRMVVVGLGAEELNGIPLNPISAKEIEITSIFRYKNLYPSTIAAIGSGMIDINNIVSKRFAFEQTPEAYESAYLNPDETVKNVIIFNGVEATAKM